MVRTARAQVVVDDISKHYTLGGELGRYARPGLAHGSLP